MSSKTEKTPLLTKPAVVPEDDETAASLRDRVTTSYTTIALVSALLAGVSFLAYATPPAVLFSAAGGSAAGSATVPVAHGRNHPTKVQAIRDLEVARVVIYKALDIIYGIVVPLAFALNLAGTLTSSGVIIFVNSLQATPAVMHSIFGSREKEHSIMRYPAFFLVGGVGSLFIGFLCGITLYYGLFVFAMIALTSGGALIFYECYWARGHSDSYNAMNLALGALFFRSCMPDLGEKADSHVHLNLPPLDKTVEERERERERERTPEKEKAPEAAEKGDDKV